MVQQMMPMDIQANAENVASNRKQWKHIGKLKDSGANVAIIFRTVPEEPNNCLVVGPKFLDDTNHNALMRAIESQEAQQSFELGSYLTRTTFPDGTNMLAFLHQGNFLKKMPTKDIIVTMGTGNDGKVSLDELNKLIAKERDVKVSELSVEDPTPKQTADATKKKTTKK
jgi:hypothetical protein|tara:strand:+ start:554 stop:1060 length:507 start_codon:yes stop_codon:yes gene_type:complete